MHLLRFPNNGIRPKVFVRKIGFKLRAMRLNCVESFYAFLLRFRSEGNKEVGQQGIARPPTRGRPTAAKAPLRRCDRPRPGRMGRLPAAHLQGSGLQRSDGGDVEGGKERARASF
ncbi:hypothetical protein BHE74_00048903 [Ensete ventricosum]|nr:hypothetical protein GW17_00053066 [Ensete ventricosum]RWW45268.1 hypothetical protein BHE74_00048903 [Ensete ventricosum]RZS04234.1 hypothetical protein BHM03_00034533 [Ensete ventricosum]